jgi:hypothetical protein
MNTNASGRDPTFWYELGKLIGQNGALTFSVDGLEDTNHIYRKGTHWDKILMAMKNYLRGGGLARWEFLVFKHNQHQIEEAKELAKTLGIQEFYEKKALGFVSHHTTNELTEGIRVYDEYNGYQYLIEPPVKDFKINNIRKTTYDKIYKSQEQMTEKIIQPINITNNIPKKPYIPPIFKLDNNRPLTEWEDKLGKCTIDCMVLEPKSFFVTSEGLVFPCCITASKYYAYGSEEVAQLKNFIDSYGKKNISLEYNSLEDIINGPMFQEKWIENFNDNDVRNKRLRTCSTFCGKETNQEFSETMKSRESTSNAL